MLYFNACLVFQIGETPMKSFPYIFFEMDERMVD